MEPLYQISGKVCLKKRIRHLLWWSIELKEVDFKTMESVVFVRIIYFAGEVLDIDGSNRRI
jgi:hypothetical protein